MSSSSTDAPLHLLSVWNPSYVEDAMDQHLEVLLDWAGRRDLGGVSVSRVF